MSGTWSDNKWQRTVIQRMAEIGTTNGKQVVQRMTTNDNE